MFPSTLSAAKYFKSNKELPLSFKLKINRYLNRKKDYANLIKLISKSKSLHKLHPHNKKLLFAPGFNIVSTFTHHDVIIASLLHSKGVIVHYTSGHERLLTPLMYGGVWSSGSNEKDFEKLKNAEQYALQFFSQLGEFSSMSTMVTKEEVEQISPSIYNLSLEELCEYSYKDILLGHDAMNRLRNLHMVSDIRLLDNHEILLKKELVNCLVYVIFFERVIDIFVPDRILSHECFYYPWSIMQKLANKHDIPFYNYYCAIRKDAYIYANDKPAMLMYMKNLWEGVNKISLSDDQKQKMTSLMEERLKGNVGRLGQERFYDSEEREKIFHFTKSKPTAVLYSNVVWDLTALDKELLFESMREGYIETVKYFINNSQYQLIIKTHPDEENPKIPVTVERLKFIIQEEIGDLPDNIVLLDSKVPVTSFDLFPLTKCSIVQTTTAGLESVIFGTPTVTMSNAHYRDKGFTYDPQNCAEYFSVLNDLLSNPKNEELNRKLAELALKYYYYFFYELFYEYGIPSMSWGGKTTPINKSSPQAFLTNKRLNYIIDTIIKGEQICFKLDT